MKKILCSLFLLAGVISLQAQSIDEIVKRHVDAIGGEENWRKVKNMVMKAKTKAQGADINITRTIVDKTAMRMDIDVFGMKGWSIMTNKEGWVFMPFQGQTKPEAMTADDIKSSQDQLQVLDEFITYKEMGKKIELVGKDDVDGVECFKIKLTEANGQETSHWIDPSNYYLIKSVSKIKANGKENEITTSFSNYRKLESGIVYAMNMSGDMTGELEITSVEVNTKIDDSIFKPTVEEEKK